jgi:AMMECR1 domain-containing protein
MSDFRFPPVEKDELDTLTVDVTLLGKPEPIDDPLDFDIGSHSLIID